MVAATLLACTTVIVLCCDAMYSEIRFGGKEGIPLINKVTRYCINNDDKVECNCILGHY